MNKFLEKCVNPLAILLILSFSTTLVCGVIKLLLKIVDYIVRENVPIIEIIAIGSLGSGILITALIVIVIALYNATK